MAAVFEGSTELREAVVAEVTGNEVLRAIATVHGHGWADIEKAAEAERGALLQRVYLEG